MPNDVAFLSPKSIHAPRGYSHAAKIGPGKVSPTSTVVQVAALFRPEFMIEIEAVAALDA
jgi:hypothetical protein